MKRLLAPVLIWAVLALEPAIALAAEGETRVSQISHIDRGYEDIAADLRALGADAERVDETENDS